VGEQRKIAFQYALDIWAKTIDSPVTIVVDASFAPLDCSDGFAVIGQAGATRFEYDEPGLTPGMLYVEALADRLVGYDLNPGEADIEAQFNGNLGACFDNYDWYYGLDGQAGRNADLVYTVLHEVAHGLGFTFQPDPADGALIMGMYDTYLEHLWNNTTGRHFHEMSDAERLASIAAPRQVVWDGQYATAAAAERLASGAPKLSVSPAVSGLWGALVEANFGPTLPAQPISGPLVVGDPSDGCSALTNSVGPVALFFHGSCSPMNVADRAQGAQARVVLMADDSGYTPPMASIEVLPEYVNALPITIPTLGISRADADLLQAASSGLTVTLGSTTGERVGADPAGHVYMYASVPGDSLSTLSHFDPLARPNLILEPTATHDYPHDLRVEQALLRDIGWEPLCGNGRVDPQEECDNGSANHDTQPGACRTTCVRAKCGDQIVDPGEECDNGSANSDTVPNACRTTCLKAKCGDQVVDTGEECDDGANNGNPGACQQDCRPPAATGTGGSGGGAVGASGSSAAPLKHQKSCSCRTVPTGQDGGWLVGALVAVLLGARRRVNAAGSPGRFSGIRHGRKRSRARFRPY
jgi:MYXO-CTERM domain-containing protein